MLDKRELAQIVAAIKPMTAYKINGRLHVSMEEIIEIINSHAEDDLRVTLDIGEIGKNLPDIAVR